MFEYGMGAQVRTNKKKGGAIKDEDVINVFLPQVGDIGIFVSAAELWQQPSGLFLPAPSAPGVDIGVQWLMQPTLPSPLPPPEAVAALALSFNAASNARARTRKYSFPKTSTLASRVAASYAEAPDTTYPRVVDNTVARGVVSHSVADDFRLLLTRAGGLRGSALLRHQRLVTDAAQALGQKARA